MSVAISIENVIKRFGKDTIINGLSLDVRPADVFHRINTYEIDKKKGTADPVVGEKEFPLR